VTDRALRVVDVVLAVTGLAVLAPVLLATALLAACKQGRPILYQAPRVGLHGRPFRMTKFRTMTQGADQGASSTSNSDTRITRLGVRLRRRKLDELPQLLNVLRGEMSLVGPRPQIRWAVDAYGERERRLLTVRPGITDLASIWFSDEGDRLAGAADADSAYLQLIAPGKTALGLAYVDGRSLGLYMRTLALTAQSMLGHDVRPTIMRMTGIDADALAEETTP
jgi:lipopolysaccharide/colanic/teichoic acid biosynthesis glycosyltransferase